MAQPNTQQPMRTEETQPASAKERKYRVKAETRVPRGGSHYVLPAGKVISSLGYDIVDLRNHGVPLEEVTERQ